jgi:hypothetical protein
MKYGMPLGHACTQREAAVWDLMRDSSISGSSIRDSSIRNSWRTYFCFVLAGAIFILCQAFSGVVTGNQAEGISPDPGDRSYRDALRIETSGRGGRVWARDALGHRADTPSDRPQTD